MFGEMKLATRLGLGFLVPLLFLLINGFHGLRELGATQRGLETVYLDRVVPLRGLKVIADAYAVDIIDAANQANAGLVTAEQALQRVSKASASIKQEWAAYMATTLTAEEAALARQAAELFVPADADVVRLIEALGGASGSLQGQFNEFDGPLYASIDPISAKIAELIELQLAVAKQEYLAANEAYQRALWSTGILLLVGTLAAVWTGLRVARALLRQLGGEPAYAVAAVRRIAAGDLSGDIRVNHAGASLLADMRHMQEQLQALLAAQLDMARRHDAGEMGFRIDTARLPGTFGEMGAAVNQLVDSHIQVNDRAMSLLGRYAVGDLSGDMEDLPGEKARITATMAQAKRNLQAINADIQRLVAAAGNGDFSARGEVAGYQFAFRDMVAGLNRLMQEAEQGLAAVGAVLAALADGDLTRRADARFRGAFGDLAGNANRALDQLEGIVGDIARASATIHSASSEIAQGNADLSSRTEQQAANLEETASSMEQLTSAVRQNTDTSKQARELATRSVDVARKGGAVVGEVVATMEQITQSSKKIGDIIGVIDGIAFQTNILALNAAVEAARAGEQGRGFAVVAAEVRALAQRSAEAAKEIKQLISLSSSSVEQGARLVDQAGATMQDIVASVQRVTDMMSEIAAASDEQASGIEQVNQTVIQMDQATQQNAALVEQATAAARAMTDQASNLNDAVGAFRRRA